MAAVPASGKQIVDGLLSGYSWSDRPGEPVTLTYAFPDSESDYPRFYSAADEPAFGFAPFSSTQQAAAEWALALWASIANIRFVRSDERVGAADIRFGATLATPAAQAYFPGEDAASGDVWINRSLPTDEGFDPGSYEAFVLLHEIGHALGLKHPHERELIDTVLKPAEDFIGLSVMSYRGFPGGPVSGAYETDVFPTTPMRADIAAIQYLYGANTTTRAGSDIYRIADDAPVWQTLYDVGGVDTIDASELARGVRINLQPGSGSEIGAPLDTGGAPIRATLWIADGTVIERAIGTDRADRIAGNESANLLDGRGGADVLSGGGGNDRLLPGPGDDRVVGGAGTDVVMLGGLADDFSIKVKGSRVSLVDMERSDGDQGRDRLKEVEFLEFDDRTVEVATLARPGAESALSQPVDLDALLAYAEPAAALA